VVLVVCNEDGAVSVQRDTHWLIEARICTHPVNKPGLHGSRERRHRATACDLANTVVVSVSDKHVAVDVYRDALRVVEARVAVLAVLRREVT